MKASTILKHMDSTLDIISQNEIEFDYMGLSSSKYNGVLFTFIDEKKYLESISEKTTVILTTKEIAAECPGISAIIVNNPRLCFFRMHNFLVQHPEYEYSRKSFKTEIGENCRISKFAFISERNVKIGSNVVIEEFVSIKANTVIKDNVIIRAGSVIGGEGFEEKRTDRGILPVVHAGGVIIGDNVEIQQNVCIDRAIYPWDNTVIADECKLDNLIHIAHAVKMGKGTLMAASTLVGGRVNIGENVWIGPGATIVNNVEIGDSAKISIGAVVTKNVGVGERVTGNFAINHDKFMDFIKSIR